MKNDKWHYDRITDNVSEFIPIKSLGYKATFGLKKGFDISKHLLDKRATHSQLTGGCIGMTSRVFYVVYTIREYKSFSNIDKFSLYTNRKQSQQSNDDIKDLCTHNP